MKLLIVGSGDHDKKLLNGDHDIMTINKEMFKVPNSKHHVSLHDVFSQKTSAINHSIKNYMNVDCVWKYNNGGGTSGLFAIWIALQMGYSKIALLGVPIDGKYNDCVTNSIWKKFVVDHKEDCETRVRSYSGETLKLFGNAKGWFE